MSTASNFTQNGILVWYTVPADAHAKVEDVVAAAEAAGLPTDHLQGASPRLALSRAVTDMNSKREGQLGRRLGIKSDTTDRSYGVAIVEESLNTDEQKLHYKQHTVGRVDLASGLLQVEGPKAQELADGFHYYNEAVCDADVRLFIQQVIRNAGGIAKRRTGGIYFVPASQGHKIESMRNLVKKYFSTLTGNAEIYIDRVYWPEGDESLQERKNLWGSVSEDLTDRLKDIRANVATINKSVKAMTERRGTLAEIVETQKVYQQILGDAVEAASIQELIADTEEFLSGKLAELVVKKSERDEANVRTRKNTKIAPLCEGIVKLLSDGKAHSVEDIHGYGAENNLVVDSDFGLNVVKRVLRDNKDLFVKEGDNYKSATAPSVQESNVTVEAAVDEVVPEPVNA